MKKLILTLFATAGLMSLSFGQYVDQALIFSQQNYGSTARSKAMGNAFGAIGGDFSSLSINPAGIGVYLRSEVTGTLNILGRNNTESTYRGQTADDVNNNFSFRTSVMYSLRQLMEAVPAWFRLISASDLISSIISINQ